MPTDSFVSDLAKLLLRVDGGMLEFDEPPPHEVAEHLVNAILYFGEPILPLLHDVFEQNWDTYDPLHFIDLLSRIGHPSSIDYLIKFHRNHGTFLSSLAAMQALSKFNDEKIHAYFEELVERYNHGDRRAFCTHSELETANKKIAEWKNSAD